jgi:DNA-binding transcriptional LysR family regulator
MEKPMELRLLRYFTAVAETGSLSRAAEKLFIAQPPLSLQIRQLEEELGVALFSRHPKGVKLTPAGEALLPEARALLDRAGQLADVVRNPSRGAAVSVSIGFVPSASSTVIPDLVRRLRKSHPDLDIRVREMISGEQNEALVAGQIDVGIARFAPRHPRITIACSVSDPFSLAEPGSQARSKASVADLQDYADHSFVAFTRHRGPAYFDQSIHLCGQAGFSPRIRYEASTVHGVMDLVSAGLGVALVPASAVLLGVKGVRVRPLRHAGKDGVMSLLHRKSDSNPVLTDLQYTTEEIFKDLEDRMLTALGAQ